VGTFGIRLPNLAIIYPKDTAVYNVILDTDVTNTFPFEHAVRHDRTGLKRTRTFCFLIDFARAAAFRHFAAVREKR